MHTLAALFGLWLAHAVIGGVLAAPFVYFGRKRVHWHRWELWAFALPFVLWLLLMVSPLSTDRKSLANLGEGVLLGFALPVATLVRVVLGGRFSERAVSRAVLVALCLVAALVFFLVPQLEE